MNPTYVTGRATFEFNGDVEPEDVPGLLPDGWIVHDVTRHQEYVELAEMGKRREESDHIRGYSNTTAQATFSRHLTD